MVRVKKKGPRILVVTPEIASVPPGMSHNGGRVVAKAGGMADVTQGIVAALYEMGADVHVALPNYRRMFHGDISTLVAKHMRDYKRKVPERRLHFAEDSFFHRRVGVYSGDELESSLRFQREVINHILTEVSPDLVHCNDWMTGLVVGAARRLDIPCLMTIHNIHTQYADIDTIERSGIPVGDFWRQLYFARFPAEFESIGRDNPVDLLASGIFSSHFVNTVSPTFLDEVVRGDHHFVPNSVRQEVIEKHRSGCAAGILNAPPERYRPDTDRSLVTNYTADDHRSGKRANKTAFQAEVGLPEDPDAPLFFWPSRLDPSQKGCELLDELLPELVREHTLVGMQIAFIADGPYQQRIRDTVTRSRIGRRVAVCDFNERLSCLGFAASDFVLMPSRFEPCGLPQMIGAIYGSLPVVHDTGGLHDTVTHLDPSTGGGNGFVFRNYDTSGLRWALSEAVRFFQCDAELRSANVARIMRDSSQRFSHAATARAYFGLYEQMLDRPLIV